MRGAGGPSATVGVATARKGELPVLVNALGTVTPVAQVVVRPQVSGVLTEVLFTEGQTVRKGQLLARIDPAPFEQALSQAQGQRMRDEAQLAAARVTLARYQQLWKQDSVARQDLDTQAALVKQLQGVVQSDKAAEGSARINLDYTRITAPLGGLIGLRAVDPGNMVTAGAATGIATITQMAPIDVKFAVPQDRVPEVLKAQRGGTLPVQALDRTRDEVLASGQFLTLDNVIDTTTGTLLGKARFSNDGQTLFPNQFVNVQMTLGATPGVLAPVTAVRTGPQGDYVYVVDGQGMAHMRAVKRGGATVENVLIDSGLAPGEVVITEGGDRVQDGGRVQLAGEPPAQGASGAGSGANGRRRNGASAPASDAQAASAPSSQPSGLDRLPPEVRERLKNMSPEERRTYIEQLRARRAAREAQGGGQ
jgi:multidrug efflux system membrane fusion protein